ncbi:MAG: hypothetical protein ACRYGG_19410 [Janthinobacterium lividum]
MQTPQEFSAHKYKQEQDFKEKQNQYRQQVIANQRVCPCCCLPKYNANMPQALQAQKAAQQAGQQQGGLGVPQPGRMAMPPSMNGSSPRLASSLPHNSTTQPGGRPLPPSQAMLNGMMPTGPNQNNQMGARPGMGVPQGQIQSYVQGQQQRLPPQNGPDRVIMEASRVQEQQRLMQQRQYQTQANGVNGVNGPSPSPHNNLNVQQSPQQLQPNMPMLGNMQMNGKPNPAIGVNGQQRSSGSPMPNPVQNQQLSSGMTPLLNQISSSLRAAHPNLPQEQIQKMATTHLNQHLRNQNSQAGNSHSNIPHPQQQQQQQQQHQQQQQQQQHQQQQLLQQQQQHQQQQQQQPQPQAVGVGYNQPPMSSHAYAAYMRTQQASQQGRQGGEGSSARPESRGGTPQTKSQNGAPPPSGSSQSPRPPLAQMASSS